MRDERPDVRGVGRDEGQRVDGAAAAREEVDRAAADGLDDPVEVVGVLLRAWTAVAGSSFALRSTPRGS